MQSWLLVALGGALGACLRFGVNDLIVLLFGRAFPFATLSVNVIGSLIMGLAYGLISHGHVAEHPLKPFLMVGLLGALTTFSSFALDTVLLVEQGSYVKALLNVLLNLFLCLAMVILGIHWVANRV